MAPRPPKHPLKRSAARGGLHPFFLRLWEAMERKGMTQSELARRLGVHTARIAALTGGAFPEDPARIVAIADLLGVSLDWLFGRADDDRG